MTFRVLWTDFLSRPACNGATVDKVDDDGNGATGDDVDDNGDSATDDGM